MNERSPDTDIDAYVRERAAPPGSTLHYVALFTSPSRARLCIALEALHQELNAVIEECREPAVAHARLGFWQEELAKLRDGRSQHPVSRVLAQALSDPGSLAERLAPALMATTAASQRVAWKSEAELADYCAATGGEIAALACGAAPVTDEPNAPSRLLGSLLCRQEMLAGLFSQPRRCVQVLPGELLAVHGVGLADLFANPASVAADRLLRGEAARLREALAAERLAADGADEGQRLLRARAAVGLATLSAIERGGADWLSRHAAVSPLRKLWIAWRHRR